jgi:quinoprotein glucose dehydrogenase
VLVGAAFETGANPKSRANVRGAVRAFDVRTGKLVWTFRTIPQPGDFGNETWENDSWAYSGNTGVWAQISVDEELGMAYLPVELPTHDYYGGARPGNTLFAESLVAVDLKTGVRKWHFQLVHHGVWDMDIPCAPILADVVVNGRPCKVVAQPSKQGFLYVFDRVTGQPIWPIEERPVPQGDVPGEKYSRTQPFPTRPVAYERQGLAVDDLIDFTPELRAEALKLIEKYRIGPIFTPPAVSKAEGPIATLAMSTQAPATNWPGGSFDPETHVLYVHSNAQVAQLGLVPPPEGAAPDVRYHQGTVLSGARRTGGSGSATTNAQGGNINGIDVRGLPIIKPPYRQDQRDQSRHRRHRLAGPHGETPEAVKNNPRSRG